MKIAFATPVVYDGNDSRYLQRDAVELKISKWQSRPDRGLDISQHWGDFFHVAPATEKLMQFATSSKL